MLHRLSSIDVRTGEAARTHERADRGLRHAL